VGIASACECGYETGILNRGGGFAPGISYRARKRYKIILIMVIFCLNIVTAVSSDYLISPARDVDKYRDTGVPYPEIDQYDSDNNACWIASASNILAFGGWGVDRSDLFGIKPVEFHIYNDLLSNFPDRGGYGKSGFETYLNWYYPDISLDNYFERSRGYYRSYKSVIIEWLDEGQVLFLSGGLYAGDGTRLSGHAFTVWGYHEVSNDPENPNYDPDA